MPSEKPVSLYRSHDPSSSQPQTLSRQLKEKVDIFDERSRRHVICARASFSIAVVCGPTQQQRHP
jgi:hypothetical protein